MNTSPEIPPPPFKVGLRFKLILGIMVIMVTIITGLTLVLLDRGKQDILDEVALRGKLLVESCRQMARFLCDDDPIRFQTDPELIPRLQQFTTNLAGQLGVDGIAVVNTNRLALVHTNPHMQGKILFSTDIDEALSTGQPVVKIGTAVEPELIKDATKVLPPKLTVAQPLFIGGKLAGAIQAKFSVDEIDKYLAFSKRRTFQFVLLESGVIIVFVSLLLSILVLRPIQRLVHATQRLSRGEWEQEAEIHSHDELGQLAESFNIMGRELRKIHQEQQETISSLKQALGELTRAQEELISSEKQAGIGRLAAGVAHEIGNPLSSILGYTEILLLGVDDPKERDEYIQFIQHEVNRIQRIIRDLLDYSRPSLLTLLEVNLGDVLDRTIRLLSAHSLYQGVEVTVEMPKNMPLIRADENMLQQAFTNIMINAAQAMEGKGALVISGRHHGGLVHMSFEDTGPGIPEAVREKIFDPFFTTKDVGQGTGLGLSVTRTIVEKMGGAISFRNLEGSRTGAVFTLTFQCAEEEMPEEAGTNGSGSDQKRGRKKTGTVM